MVCEVGDSLRSQIPSSLLLFLLCSFHGGLILFDFRHEFVLALCPQFNAHDMSYVSLIS